MKLQSSAKSTSQIKHLIQYNKYCYLAKQSLLINRSQKYLEIL